MVINKLFSLLTYCCSLVIFILSIWTINKNFYYYNTQNMWNILLTVPLSNILEVIALTKLKLCNYDRI